MVPATRTTHALRVGPFSLLLIFAVASVPEAADTSDRDAAGNLARQALKATGVKGGLIVHVGCGDGRSTPGFKAGEGCLVQGLDTDAEDVRKAREHVRSLGLPVTRHSYFDPRIKGYKLRAGKIPRGGASKTAGQKGKRERRATSTIRPVESWSTNIPLTGKAMVLAGDVLFVAGTPVQFPPDEPAEKYEAAYEGRMGGIMWAVSATDGSKLAEYRLDAAPAWDGLAAAENRLFLCTSSGSVVCFGK